MVRELFVQPDQVEETKHVARSLPKLQITKVKMINWIIYVYYLIAKSVDDIVRYVSHIRYRIL